MSAPSDDRIVELVSEACEVAFDGTVSPFLHQLRNEGVPQDVIAARRDELAEVASQLVRKLQMQLSDVIAAMRSEGHRPPDQPKWPAPIQVRIAGK